MHFPYKKFYEIGIQIFLPGVTTLGVITGINVNSNSFDQDAFCLFRNIITYTTIGLITGFTFPISIPLISAYTLYRHYTLCK